MADPIPISSGGPTLIAQNPEELPTQEAPEISPAPHKIQLSPVSTDHCRDTVFFIGDQQYHLLPYLAGLYRSLVINSRAPGHRLLGSNMADFTAHQTLVTQAHDEMVPKECQDAGFYKGMASMGDTTDVAAVDEWRSLIQALDRLKQINPAHRILSFVVGNHEVFHAGTSRAGTDFWGLLGFALKLDGERAYGKDIHLPEVADESNILNKKVLIQAVYKYFLGRDPDPVTLKSVTSTHYLFPTASKQKAGSWDDTAQVFKQFWKQEADGSYNLLVHFKNGREEEYPETKWIFASAAKLGEYDTQVGKMPVFLIGLDTMDYTYKSSAMGAVEGHVSPAQVEMIRAFMTEQKKINPNTKFIFSAHYRLRDIEHPEFSELNLLMSDPAVIAFVGAHTHRRDYADLNEESLAAKFKIHRTTPLPEINVPSVIDFPNEMTAFQYGMDGDEFKMEFTYRGIDQKRIPGDGPLVTKEFKAIQPFLNTYRETLKSIKDPLIKELASPQTSLWRQVYLVTHFHKGFLWQEGRIYDTLVARDVIPFMVEDAKLFMKMNMAITRLNLAQIGMNDDADELTKINDLHLASLNHFYDKILAGEYSDLSATFPLQEAEAQTDAFLKITSDILEKLDRRLAGFTGSMASDAKILLVPQDDEKTSYLVKLTRDILSSQRDFLINYKEWLIEFQQHKRSGRSDEELVTHANLFGHPSYRTIQRRVQELPQDNMTYAFLLRVFMESSLQRQQHYHKTNPANVPDKIAVRFNPVTEEVILDPKPLPDKTDAEIKEEVELLGHAPGMKEFEFQKYVEPETFNHFNFRLQKSFDRELAFGFQFGGILHLLDNDSAPRLNFLAFGGVKTDGPFGIEFPGRVAVTIGDPYGLVDVGPMIEGGLGLTGKHHWGAGLEINFFEGVLSIDWARNWYFVKDGQTQVEDITTLGIDFVSLGQFLQIF